MFGKTKAPPVPAGGGPPPVPGGGGRRRFAALAGIAVREVDADEISDVRPLRLNRSREGAGNTETTEDEGARGAGERNPRQREAATSSQWSRCVDGRGAVPEE